MLQGSLVELIPEYVHRFDTRAHEVLGAQISVTNKLSGPTHRHYFDRGARPTVARPTVSRCSARRTARVRAAAGTARRAHLLVDVGCSSPDRATVIDDGPAPTFKYTLFDKRTVHSRYRLFGRPLDSNCAHEINGWLANSLPVSLKLYGRVKLHCDTASSGTARQDRF